MVVRDGDPYCMIIWFSGRIHRNFVSRTHPTREQEDNNLEQIKSTPIRGFFCSNQKLVYYKRCYFQSNFQVNVTEVFYPFSKVIYTPKGNHQIQFTRSNNYIP